MEYVIAPATVWVREPTTGPVLITQGERWAADDPFVKRHPGAFVVPDENDIRTTVAKPTRVEQATKAPGEKRTRG
jgi:hypothetical protein